MQNQDRLAAEQRKDSHKCLMFPKNTFLGDNVTEAKQHWTNFEKYVNTQQPYNTLASCAEFANTLSGHVYLWFQTV